MLEELADDNAFLEFYVAGSYRRGRETLGDLDILVISESPLTPSLLDPGVMLPSLVTWQRSGPRIANGDLMLPDGPLHVDIWQAPPSNRAAMLLFVTGSQQTNLRMRGRAKAMSLALSQDGLKDRESGELVPGIHEEEDIFEALRMPYLPPEER
jgi:DNA polymerase (family 10)